MNLLLRAIQAEAECAQWRANPEIFRCHVEHIHRLCEVIENRVRGFEEKQKWSLLDRLMEEVDEV